MNIMKYFESREPTPEDITKMHFILKIYGSMSDAGRDEVCNWIDVERNWACDSAEFDAPPNNSLMKAFQIGVSGTRK